ncbi:maleylpyruvate isomerase N-terminal domain-containing protein [Streptomyces sp. 3211]|uniref:maleylpyruvate isomerase N-terminal domain-containing protein n=1 Tax=Streptomyces sp. 3211 TaxID=1964449 RepID=UPI0009A548E7|nr:maleylpyruvate isomerase N-terminal domain-containing protein [Streptomyces sp. 3211]
MPYEEEGQCPADVLRAAYGAFDAVVTTITDERSWLSTGCAGWSVRDLVFHCLSDAQRGLVALHTPAGRTPDRDAVTYWEDWRPDAVGAANGRRFTRVVASMFLHVDQLCELYSQTVAAVVDAAAGVAPDQYVATQGHVLSAGDLIRTLAVEATIHHLDLVVSLPDAPGPSAEGLGQTRRTLDGLLGHPAPVPWDDAQYARVATGRASLSDSDRQRLGADAARFPLFA